MHKKTAPPLAGLHKYGGMALMTNLQYLILKYLLYTPRTIDQIAARLNRFRVRKIKRPLIERAVNALDEEYIIEELGKKEKRRLETTGEETTGAINDWSGFYIATGDYGLELGEDLCEDRRRFYMPFLFSALFSGLSILISVLALVLSLA